MGCTSSDIFLIKAENFANSGSFGVGCFNDEFKVLPDAQSFLNRYYVSSSKSLCLTLPPWAVQRSSCNSEEKIEYDIEVAKYGGLESAADGGGLVNKEIFYSLNSQQNLTEIEETQGTSCEDNCCPEGGTTYASFQYRRENGIVVENTIDCNIKNGTPPGCNGEGGYLTDTYCGNFQNTNCSPTSTPTDCTTYSFDYTNPTCNGYGFGDGFLNVKAFGSLSTPVNYDKLAPKVAEANDKKINILHKNSPQNDQGDNCGNERTSCYQLLGENHSDPLYSPTGFGGWDIIGQKWRVKVAATESELKSDLSQKYQLYTYYYTGQNPDTTVSPCCNSCECFDGTIVAQKYIELRYDNDYKKSEYNGEYILSSDYIEFDNFEYTGSAKNLYYCSKKI